MNDLIISDVDKQTVVQTLKKINEFQAVVKEMLKKEHDFDVIPGTNKPTLLKPGAEKICMMLGVAPDYELLTKTEDYQTEFFAYTVKCNLLKNGMVIGQGLGSCNSKENKYRYINVKEADLPESLDKSTLKSRVDKYGRTVYKIENDDICTIANTVLKMAKKRAHVDATLQLAALSEIFTQDVEDMKQFVQAELSENMTVDEAAKMTLNFGKHKGKTLADIWKNDKPYLDWLKAEAKDAIVKKAIGIMEAAVAEKHKPEAMPEAVPVPEPTPTSPDVKAIETAINLVIDKNTDAANLPADQRKKLFHNTLKRITGRSFLSDFEKATAAELSGALDKINAELN